MRFQTKLFLFFALLFGIAFLVRSLVTYRVQKEQVVELTSDIHNIIKVVFFATQKSASDKERDRASLTQFITEAVTQYKALSEISIVNVNQEIVASSNPLKVGKYLSDIWKEKMIDGRLHQGDTLDWYELTIPIIKDQKVIGQVLASILLSNPADSLNALYIQNAIITTLLFLVVTLVSFLGIRKITAPLRRLSTAARAIAAGDLNVKIQEKGHDERGEVAAAFNAMTGKLRELHTLEERLRNMERNAILSETAATLAHEIRNPLNLINLVSGRLAHKFQPNDAQRQREFDALITELKAQVKYLNDMVTDFLAVGKPLTLKKTSFLVSDLLQQVTMLAAAQANAGETRIIVQCPPQATIVADLEQMRLVLVNLAINALEAVGTSGLIDVRVAEENNMSIFRVIDNGPGIAPDELEKVFEPYFSKRPGGTGLGLALARRIVEEHGGKIRAENNSAGGSCFTVTIPQKG